MVVKTVTHAAALAVLYGLLVFFATTWWQAAVLAVLLGLVLAGIGFNVQHDASHGAYARSRGVNRVLAHGLDLLGGSSYVWRTKHNHLHHTHPNVAGRDDDIDIGILGRLSPAHRRLPFHRLQHFYLWILYGFLSAKWFLLDDFVALARGRVGGGVLPRPGTVDLIVLFAGKVVFATMAFVLPALFHPFWVVLIFYGVTSFTLGLTLAIVFQLAHCVEEADFSTAGDEEGDFALRQLGSTVDFAHGNRLLTWYLGGLNYQVEHHLFPRICHVHYPALAPIVRQACADHGVTHRTHPTFRSALRSHYRWLRRMGRPG
jgi:linoleoyl-CoA desaturase